MKIIPDKLQVICPEISKITPDVIEFAEKLRKYAQHTLHVASLSANQVGSNLRVCVIREGKKWITAYNPYLADTQVVAEECFEKCLSFPGKLLQVRRYTKCKIEYVVVSNPREGIKIKKITREVEGEIGRVWQHEIGHLNGVVGRQLPADIRTFRKKEEKPGRNDPCPLCLKQGLHIKFKKCKIHEYH